MIKEMNTGDTSVTRTFSFTADLSAYMGAAKTLNDMVSRSFGASEWFLVPVPEPDPALEGMNRHERRRYKATRRRS